MIDAALLANPVSSAPKLRLARSNELLARARKTYAGLTSSMMKRPDQFCPGSFPTYLESGSGAVVRDVDGNQYVDFVCALGAGSLGHAHPAIRAALTETLHRGTLHSLPLALELDAAEAVLEAVPGGERLRFFKTGADATSASVRISRAITGRERIAVVGYNGWHDHFTFDTPGVPSPLRALTERFNLMIPAQEQSLIERVSAGERDLAAVVLSAPYNRIVTREFLLRLREACQAAGTLLVLDEIVTGYRLALGGLQERLGVEADLVCVSKALAAGMPLSAVVGPASHMAYVEKLQVSTTFGGESLSLAACIAAHSVYRTTDYFSHVARLGARLREGVNRVSQNLGSPLRVTGYDAIPMFLFSHKLESHVPLATQFVGLMARRGCLLRRDVNFVCAAHTESQIDEAIVAASESLAEMQQAGLFTTQRG